MRKICKDDIVVVTCGKDRGKQGKVLKVLDGKQVIVHKINLVKRHQKPAPMREGGIIEKEMPIDISNVMLVNPSTQKGERVGFRTLEDGRKVRYFKKSGEIISAV